MIDPVSMTTAGTHRSGSRFPARQKRPGKGKKSVSMTMRQNRTGRHLRHISVNEGDRKRKYTRNGQAILTVNKIFG
jgi:hypothetical protein